MRHANSVSFPKRAEIQLQSEGGLISARITNRNDSEVRVEDLWIASVEATGKTTLVKNRIRKFKRCTAMPHAMPPHSSFEAIFNLSEAGFHSYAQAYPQHAQIEYWVEVKLEDGVLVSSNHKQLTSVSRPADDITNVFKSLEIEALPATPNLENKTQLGWQITGRPVFDGDCIFRINNPNPTQEIDGVEFRLLSIQPPLVSFRGFDPTTDDTKLRRLRFSFTDIDGKTLRGNQSGDICVLAVTRNFAAEESLKNIHIEFGGTRTTDTKNKFVPATTDHILTVEVTANGLSRTESQFHISFSTKADKPVFTITKVS